MKRYFVIILLLLALLQPQVLAQTASELPNEKNPWLAAGISLIAPGGGQMYVNEQVWPEILWTGLVLGAAVAWYLIAQWRDSSVMERITSEGPQNLADARLDAFTLIFQIGVPSLWLWNAGDAYRQAESSNEKVTGTLDSQANAYIIEENLVSVTLWQF